MINSYNTNFNLISFENHTEIICTIFCLRFECILSFIFLLKLYIIIEFQFLRFQYLRGRRILSGLLIITVGSLFFRQHRCAVRFMKMVLLLKRIKFVFNYFNIIIYLHVIVAFIVWHLVSQNRTRIRWNCQSIFTL